ncbi:MAG: GDP-mannose 4,6-dehydratase [Deltaproteobacteria bacterium]|nr:GDP-mannose 4,6-dehydratase [Deltaproteobacteria bacterium]
MLEAFNNASILVTGGAGFVGSNLVDFLLAQGAKVRVLDDLYTGRLEQLPKHANLDFVQGSVTDEPLIAKLIPDADYVFHLAARNIIVSMKDPRNDFEVNVGGTLRLLLAARDAKRLKRIVYTSTSSVYGNPRYLPINEDDELNVLSPYSVSKLSAEHYFVSFFESYGVPFTTVRYSNVYGINQSVTNPYCGVVSKFMASASKGEPIQIHGDGKQTRDFTFVKDAVEATAMVAVCRRAEGEVFNIGTGIETSINDLAAKIGEALGRPNAPLAYIDRRDIDNIRRRVVNIEKLRRRVRWVPRYTLEHGLKATRDWIATQKHPS